MLVMGDDNLFCYKTLDYKKYLKDMEQLGFKVHPDKQEYGLFFLQNRLYTSEDGKLCMVYP